MSFDVTYGLWIIVITILVSAADNGLSAVPVRELGWKISYSSSQLCKSKTA